MKANKPKGLGALIDAQVSCTKCGSKGVSTCDCWVRCACGWLKGKDEPCQNPIHSKAKGCR